MLLERNLGYQSFMFTLRDDQQYQLFMFTHYIIERKQSLRPVWSKGGMVFPYTVSVRRKQLSILEKLKYYLLDLKLWLIERSKLKKILATDDTQNRRRGFMRGE